MVGLIWGDHLLVIAPAWGLDQRTAGGNIYVRPAWGLDPILTCDQRDAGPGWQQLSLLIKVRAGVPLLPLWGMRANEADITGA